MNAKPALQLLQCFPLALSGLLTSPSEVHLRCSSERSGVPMMVFEAILNEVDQLHSVSTRLEGLAEQTPPVSKALITIAGNVRNSATILAVVVATKTPKLI
jgi:hypothetical protein